MQKLQLNKEDHCGWNLERRGGCCEETDLDSRRGSSRKPWMLAFPSPHFTFSTKAGVLHRILKPMAKSILVCIPIFLGDFGKNSLLGINNIRWGLFCQVVNRSLWMVCFQLMVMLSMCSYDPFLDVETEAQLNLLIFTQLAEDVSRWCSNPPVRPQCLLSSPPSHPQLFVCILHGLDIYISVHHC